MFNFLSKRFKKEPSSASINTEEELISFDDLLKQEVVISREVSGNNFLLSLQIDDKKIILDEELCVVLISVFKEYCITNDIKSIVKMLKEKDG